MTGHTVTLKRVHEKVKEQCLIITLYEMMLLSDHSVRYYTARSPNYGRTIQFLAFVDFYYLLDEEHFVS